MATFKITLRTRAGGDDGIRTLRAALKLLLRRFGLRAIKIEKGRDKSIVRNKTLRAGQSSQ